MNSDVEQAGRMCFSSRVPPHYAGLTLEKYLAKRFTYRTQEEWREEIAAGRIILRGVPAQPESVVSTDDEVTYHPAPFDEPEAELNFAVVFEDEWLLGISKPGNLLVHRAGRAFTHNLLYLIRTGRTVKPWPEASAVNRLDRETSGVVIVVKKSADVQRMQAALRARICKKRYVAVVRGKFDMERREINAPVGRDPMSPLSYVHAVRPDGKPALTLVESVEHCGRYSILRLCPVTGRTHQLRLHCAFTGFPIVGDRLYGRPEDRHLFARQALHCERIEFVHPWTQQWCAIEAPLPDDMKQLIRKIRESRLAQCD